MERFRLIPAVYLVLRRGDEVLMLQRAGTSYQNGKYSFVAGHIDGDEPARQALAREAQEEAGIIIEPADLTFVHASHRLMRGYAGQERLDLFFEARHWQGEITNAEPEKCSDLSWFPVYSLPEATIPFIRLVLADIARGQTYSEYLEEPE